MQPSPAAAPTRFPKPEQVFLQTLGQDWRDGLINEIASGKIDKWEINGSGNEGEFFSVSLPFRGHNVFTVFNPERGTYRGLSITNGRYQSVPSGQLYGDETAAFNDAAFARVAEYRTAVTRPLNELAADPQALCATCLDNVESRGCSIGNSDINYPNSYHFYGNIGDISFEAEVRYRVLDTGERKPDEKHSIGKMALLEWEPDCTITLKNPESDRVKVEVVAKGEKIEPFFETKLTAAGVKLRPDERSFWTHESNVHQFLRNHR